MSDDNEIITELPPGFVADFADEILGTIPEEKVQCDLRQTSIQRVMQAVGSIKVEGLGQKVAEIDGRLWHRLFQEAGKDPSFIHDYLADNPYLCAPGYKPRSSATRHGKSFMGGKPI